MPYEEFLDNLEQGSLRAAFKVDGAWVVNTEVKEKILEVFKNSKVIDMPGGFCDKEPLKTRAFSAAEGVRLVPGGSSIRRGAYIAKNVVIVPPSYINIGAYVDEGTVVDSHVLVGSCAQIGKNVHLGAGAQIGGVLEPIGSAPVIVEDDCFIGAGVILVEGILVKQKTVIAPGVTLTKGVPIYDLVKNETYKGVVPEGAVVVPGSRPVKGFVDGLTIACAIIVKYRDSKTDAALALEEALR